MNYIQYAPTGEILCFGEAPDGASLAHMEHVLEGVDPIDGPLENHYVLNGAVVSKPPQPSQFHAWDWLTKSWLPDLAAALTARKREIDAEFVRRDLAPIAYAGAAFDADTQARENISGALVRLLRGDGLPGGWIGWRDRANAMHWATDDAATVQAHLAALSRAIEDRKQALLVAAWQHKAAIAALTDISAVLAHDLAAGWPA